MVCFGRRKVNSTAIDWRGFCSEIRDQGQCGSCTAFGSIGAWEANIHILEGLVQDLSEQDLFACSGGTCDGGNTVEDTLNYAENKGVCIEDDDPYTSGEAGEDKACGLSRKLNPIIYKLSTWVPVTDVAEMKTLLMAGPLVGCMDVHQSFMNYLDGVYHSLGRKDPMIGGHCIAVVGYDDSKNAWICRNSWGTGWGIQGYFYIQYGDSGIDDIMYQIIPEKP